MSFFKIQSFGRKISGNLKKTHWNENRIFFGIFDSDFPARAPDGPRLRAAAAMTWGSKRRERGRRPASAARFQATCPSCWSVSGGGGGKGSTTPPRGGHLLLPGGGGSLVTLVTPNNVRQPGITGAQRIQPAPQKRDGRLRSNFDGWHGQESRGGPKRAPGAGSAATTSWV